MGKQHFEPVNWSGKMTDEEMQQTLKEVKQRDRIKKRLMKKDIKAGRVNHFIVFTYKEPITEEYVRNKLEKEIKL